LLQILIAAPGICGHFPDWALKTTT